MFSRTMLFEDINTIRRSKNSNLKTAKVHFISFSYNIAVHCRVHTAQGKPGKRDFFEKKSGKPQKVREFSDHFYNLRKNSGNFILPNISGGTLRVNE